MSERELNIRIPNTALKIYGVFREVVGAPVVVFVHGFTGYLNEHQFYNGARALEAAGFSSYRFNLYGQESDARQLISCSVRDHIADMDLVVRTFKQQEPDRLVSVVGHSLGGIVVLCSADRGFDAAVLWDPSHVRRAVAQDATWLEALGCWKVHDNVDILVGDALMKSWADAPVDGVIQEFDVPTKVITAGAGNLQSVGVAYASELPGPHEYAVVPEADHCFCVGDTAQSLYAETVKWLRSYGR